MWYNPLKSCAGIFKSCITWKNIDWWLQDTFHFQPVAASVGAKKHQVRDYVF